ncbi:PD-(D/E)XK motif protein [Clavibacter michiganensis]|uniref:PD-(D/E)XK motif protein n=1 Tax=Clavibacter michiganensis TaxID=28447 RepID=UPI002185A530|nr:PD-(D/E)XK motif protein [Clavibacter michiganensis]MDO4058650.1 PD-(D/E)XK motif protein [Clavibacter michiganensis]MWJ68392.1 hypothetical protein [Clavibacter michiganensis subsp. michiganensis]UQZ30963.1 PD-(D/E)XK motif protein [Clavibacter michiganensis subsp. michiganensis]
MISVAQALEAVLQRPAHQVIMLEHPWLHLYAQNDSGRPAVVIEVDEIPEKLGEDGKGFTVTADFQPRREIQYVRITARTATVEPAFATRCGHLLDASRKAAGKDAAVADLFTALQDFRALLARAGRRLSESELRGLAAELILMREIVRRGIPVARVMRAWQGPYGASQDFAFASGHFLEAKSVHRSSTKVVISSAEQLVIASGTLQLVVVPVERCEADEPDAQSLADLILDVRDLAADDSTAGLLLEDALGALGVDSSEDFYSQWHFVSDASRVYEVDEAFPRIRLEHVPSAVSRVSYDLELAGLDDHRAELRMN